MEILYYLKKNGCDIFIFSTGTEEDAQKLNGAGFSVFDVGSVVANPLKAIIFFYNLYSQIRKLSPSIIFSFTIRPNIFGSLVARFLGIPIVSNVTGTGPLTVDNGFMYRMIRLLYKVAFLKNQRVFFQNEDDMQYFLSNRYVSSTQVRLLPGSGVDTDYFYPTEKISSRFTFLMVSRLIRDKGVIEYVKAAKIVRNQYPEICFQILGPFWTQSVSKNTITKEELNQWVNEGWVEYLGYTLDVRPYMGESDCVVLPSYREGCANVLMQGASMSKPLIATKVTGCQNLVEDGNTGLLVRLKDEIDLAEKMIAMYQMKEAERREMGKKGRQKMQNEYQKQIVLMAYQNEIDWLNKVKNTTQ